MLKSNDRKIGAEAVWQGAALIVLSAVIALSVNAIRPDGLPLIGDWSADSRAVSKTGERLVISLEEAETLFVTKQAVFIDARPVSEYQAGHIRGAYSLPFQAFNEHIDAVLPHLSEHLTIITYCDGETCELSTELAQALIDMGFPKVRVLVNGWTVWTNRQLPTDR